eukprot:Opistho-2@71779
MVLLRMCRANFVRRRRIVAVLVAAIALFFYLNSSNVAISSSLGIIISGIDRDGVTDEVGSGVLPLQKDVVPVAIVSTLSMRLCVTGHCAVHLLEDGFGSLQRLLRSDESQASTVDLQVDVALIRTKMSSASPWHPTPQTHRAYRTRAPLDLRGGDRDPTGALRDAWGQGLARAGYALVVMVYEPDMYDACGWELMPIVSALRGRTPTLLVVPLVPVATARNEWKALSMHIAHVDKIGVFFESDAASLEPMYSALI